AAFALPTRRAALQAAVSEALAERTSRWQRLWAYIRSVADSPIAATATAGALAAIVIVGALMFYPRQLHPEPLSIALVSNQSATHRTMSLSSLAPGIGATTLKTLVSLPEHHRAGIGFGFDRAGKRPVYHIADPMRLGVSAPRGRQTVVLDVHSADEAYVL